MYIADKYTSAYAAKLATVIFEYVPVASVVPSSKAFDAIRIAVGVAVVQLLPLTDPLLYPGAAASGAKGRPVTDKLPLPPETEVEYIFP